MKNTFSQLQEAVKERYLTVVRESARGIEVDPDEALQACIGMGRSIEQMAEDVALCEERITKQREFEEADYPDQIEHAKAEKLKAYKDLEKAKTACEKANEALRAASERSSGLTNRVSYLTRQQHDAGRDLSAFLRRTGEGNDWEIAENFKLTE